MRRCRRCSRSRKSFVAEISTRMHMSGGHGFSAVPQQTKNDERANSAQLARPRTGVVVASWGAQVESAVITARAQRPCPPVFILAAFVPVLRTPPGVGRLVSARAGILSNHPSACSFGALNFTRKLSAQQHLTFFHKVKFPKNVLIATQVAAM